MKHDKELEEFRKLMTPPKTFQQGFSFSSLAAAIFVGLIMIPGSLYMELLAGQGVGAAAQWVTVILFIEVAKRANSALSRAQIFVLFYMAGAIASQSVAGTPLFQQFLVRSEAAISSGLAPHFPNWVVALVQSDLVWFGDCDFTEVRHQPLTERERSFCAEDVRDVLNAEE